MDAEWTLWALRSALAPMEITEEKAEILLETAKDCILDEIGRDELPERLVSAQVQLAVVIFNREGAEGESSRSEGGITRSFIDGLPAEIRSRLKNYPRKVGVIRETYEQRSEKL